MRTFLSSLAAHFMGCRSSRKPWSYHDVSSVSLGSIKPVESGRGSLELDSNLHRGEEAAYRGSRIGQTRFGGFNRRGGE